MTRRLLPCLALMVFAVACTPTDPIEDVTSASWAGELTATNGMLIMTVAQRGTTLSGSGGFSTLLVAGSTDSFTLAGTRRADTLDLLLTRHAGQPVHFVGFYYTGRVVLTGKLTGGEFYDTPVTLVRQQGTVPK